MLERLKMFRELDLDVQTTGATLYVYTDVPGGLALRDTIEINTGGLRAAVNCRLLTMTGQYIKVKLVGPGTLYEAKVCLRMLGVAGSWVWAQLPLRRTPEGFSSAKLPIRETAEGFGRGKLPIRATGDWNAIPVPMLGYDRDWRWVQLAVDAIE